jgi:hypothetical protein
MQTLILREKSPQIVELSRGFAGKNVAIITKCENSSRYVLIIVYLITWLHVELSNYSEVDLGLGIVVQFRWILTQFKTTIHFVTLHIHCISLFSLISCIIDNFYH